MPYDSFTIDTNAVIQGGINFDVGLLAQLEQFKNGPTQFVLSEIVIRETLKYLNATAKKARDGAITALNKAVQNQIITEGAAKSARDALSDYRGIAQKKVAGFLEATGAEVVPAKLCTVDALIKAYFEPSAPFDSVGEKKNEFPDAIALLSLEAWARDSGRTLLAVSMDKGWKDFAANCDYIHVEEDLANALQIVQGHVDAAASAVSAFLAALEKGELTGADTTIREMIKDRLTEWEFDVDASSYYRYEVTGTELQFEDYSIEKDDDGYDLTIVRMTGEEVVVRVGVNISAAAIAYFTLYGWDSIDREEFGMGSAAAESDENFDAAILLTIGGNLEGPVDNLDVIEIEMVEGLGSVNYAEIAPDWGDEYDEFDQLLTEQQEGAARDEGPGESDPHF